MTTNRPKLHRPDPDEGSYRKPPNIEIQPRDIQIIELVYKHRLLSSRQIYALVEGSANSLKRRLQLLWLHKYLCRPSDQRVLRIRGELKYLIYSLGPKGAEILAAEKGYDIAKLNWIQRSEVNFRFIDHNLFVSQFFTCLKLAVRETDGVKLVKWRQGKGIEEKIARPDFLNARESRAKTPLFQPDAFFVLYSVERDKRRFFFLEADKGTVREKSMVGRYKKYAAYHMQRGHRNRGIPKGVGFKVVTVTDNQRRSENLIERLEEELEKRKKKKDSEKWLNYPEVFWFGAAKWDIENPIPILNRCFKTPGKEKLYSLIGDGFV